MVSPVNVSFQLLELAFGSVLLKVLTPVMPSSELLLSSAIWRSTTSPQNGLASELVDNVATRFKFLSRIIYKSLTSLFMYEKSSRFRDYLIAGRYSIVTSAFLGSGTKCRACGTPPVNLGKVDNHETYLSAGFPSIVTLLLAVSIIIS